MKQTNPTARTARFRKRGTERKIAKVEWPHQMYVMDCSVYLICLRPNDAKWLPDGANKTSVVGWNEENQKGTPGDTSAIARAKSKENKGWRCESIRTPQLLTTAAKKGTAEVLRDETTQQASSTHCTSVLFTHGPRMSHELQSLTTSHNAKPCWVSTSSSILWSSGGPTGKRNCMVDPRHAVFFSAVVQSRFWSRQISAKRNYRTSNGLYNGSDAAGVDQGNCTKSNVLSDCSKFCPGKEEMEGNGLLWWLFHTPSFLANSSSIGSKWFQSVFGETVNSTSRLSFNTQPSALKSLQATMNHNES